MLRNEVTPIGALARGFLAGMAGAAAQTLFFRTTARIAPPAPEGAFEPPELEQHAEQPTETVARRLVERFMARGPLDAEKKRRLAAAVHYAFGGTWGGLYGLFRESSEALGGPGFGALYGAAVWAIADNGILPLFLLAPPPHRTTARQHGYALAAHLVYGLGLWGAYEALRAPGRALAAAGALAAIGGARRPAVRERVGAPFARARRAFARL
jgi:hypothetical protein